MSIRAPIFWASSSSFMSAPAKSESMVWMMGSISASDTVLRSVLGAGLRSTPPLRAKKAADSRAEVMSMWSTNTSSGTRRGMAVKSTMLRTPARTRASAAGLRRLRGDRQDGDADALLGHHPLQIVHAVHGAAFDGGPDEGRVGVEAGRDPEQGAAAREVGQHRAPQPAQAHQSDVLAGGAVEEALDAGQAGVDLVAAIGAAGVADDHEVPADLGGAHTGQVGQLMGVDVGGAGRPAGCRAAAGRG